jgi:hypothetical protein
MAISERVTRGLSLRLITAVVMSMVGWPAAGQAGSLCSQVHPCTPQASLTCCCYSSPGPSDAVRLSVDVRPSGAQCHSSLMDSTSATGFVFSSVPTPSHPARHVDLGLLYRTFLI